MAEKKESAPAQNELDTVVEAGRILMESGAEIYRISETMEHMANALEIDSFDAFVINRGIFASGKNHEGQTVAKITNVPDATLHLGRIEAVNSLSREIDMRHDISLSEITTRLQDIRKETVTPLWLCLLAYFTATGTFCFAIGSTLEDSLASAISATILGLTLYLIQKYVTSAFLRIIIGSAALTLSANLLFLAGLGIHRGLIILGGFIVIVPGATFTNSIRELSQNNYATGLTLLLSATLTCLAMAVGVVVTTEFLPFADQMTDAFYGGITSSVNILIRALMAAIGTIAFSVLFHAPRKYYLDQGIMGAASWVIYHITNMVFQNVAAAIFIAALSAALLARLMAVRRKCPSTIFLSVSIFPLLPGLTFYRGVYFMITRNEALAWTFMHGCFITVFTIAIAISIAQQIPAEVFAGHRK